MNKNTLKQHTLSILVLFSLILTGCGLSPTTVASAPTALAASPTQVPVSIESTQPAPAATFTPSPAPTSSTVTLTVLYTSDEHGWMEGVEPGRGAAEMVGLWNQNGYAKQGPVLILSGGDNWTGPAISTWFSGESMVDVMNAAGYQASAIGNHDFDFGLEGLRARLDQADFPYLAANLVDAATGQVPSDLGWQPYTVIEEGGLRIGVIGLSNPITPLVTNPKNVEGFDFTDPEQALRDTMPLVKAENVDLTVVVSHLCLPEAMGLSKTLAELGIALIGGGHCHEEGARQMGDVVVLGGGQFMESYAYAVFSVDPQDNTFQVNDLGTVDNQKGKADPEIASIIQDWKGQTDAELNVSIGYLKTTIGRQSSRMASLITESWLQEFPDADVALTNWGGMRDMIPSGSVTISNLISVMPFDNTIVSVRMTGAQLLSMLATDLAVGGLRHENGKWIVKSSGEKIDPAATYTVLVNDFMFNGGDGYEELATYDPQAIETGLDWRQPVIDWIREQGSTEQSPLNDALQSLIDN